MSVLVSQITSLTVVYSTFYSAADQRKHQSSASLTFVRGIQRGPVNSPHKWPVTRKMFPFGDVIMSINKATLKHMGKLITWNTTKHVHISFDTLLYGWYTERSYVLLCHGNIGEIYHWHYIPDSKIHGANMGPTWVLLAPGGPHVGPLNLAIRDLIDHTEWCGFIRESIF